MKGFIFCILLLQITTTQAQDKELVKLTDMLKIKTAGNITVNKQGTKAVFTVTSIEPDEKSKADYKYQTQLYLIDFSAAALPKQLTFAKESATAPAWSPDGNTIAFVRTMDGKPQIFIMPLSGGEAFQLTKGIYGGTNPKWSPDGSRIVYASTVALKDLMKDSILNAEKKLPSWPSEKPGITMAELQKVARAKSNPDGNMDEIRSYLAINEADGKATVLNKLNFQDETNISSNIDFTQFFSIEAKHGAEPKTLLSGFSRYSTVDFTPDGKQLLITADIDSLEHPDRSLESQIYTADADGKNLRLFLGRKGMRFTNATVSASGKWLAYQSVPVDGEVATLHIKLLNHPSPAFEIPLDRSKSNITWSADEKHLYFTAQSNGGVPLYKVEMATKKVEMLTGVDAGITSFGIGSKQIIYTKTSVANPSDLYIADVDMKNERIIGNFNVWVKTKKLSMPEKKSFVNEKGLTIEYWVMKPTNFSAEKKYPLLLEIHGGPTAMWGPGEASMWHEFQYFAAKGYGIVYSNPRGSGGYGAAFVKANENDWGTGPAADVLTAVDKTVTEGWADTTKLLITGGSYAGYLTAWIIAHDNRFKAACAQRGVYDLATFFGEGNAWRLVPRYFGGYPWQPNVKSVIERESPIHYVQNITTPLIIFHGDNDRRTGFVQSEMLYRSLKILGRPVEYVRHPGASHEITRSGDNRQRMDQMLRTYEFFERWIK